MGLGIEFAVGDGLGNGLGPELGVWFRRGVVLRLMPGPGLSLRPGRTTWLLLGQSTRLLELRLGALILRALDII